MVLGKRPTKQQRNELVKKKLFGTQVSRNKCNNHPFFRVRQSAKAPCALSLSLLDLTTLSYTFAVYTPLAPFYYISGRLAGGTDYVKVL
jgi:hypothetical protein